MTDVLTPEQRHKCMSRIRSTDTKPEMIVRSWLHGKGYRYRLHQKSLMGKPDIVMRKYRLAIFLNGCFWHRHSGCKYAATPKANSEFWQRKFDANTQRDAKNIEELNELGWNVLILWECEVKDGTYKAKFTECIEILQKENPKSAQPLVFT
jgi:DNA mismatch endonuclease (patch repair protein)